MKLMMLLYVLLLLFGCGIKIDRVDKRIKRVALVIGNQDYGDNSLQNPINDAKAIKQTLEKIGFSVILRVNVTLREFYQALNRIEEKIEPNNTILFFYFAGHGNTLNHKNSEEYLMMSDKKEKVLISIHRLYEFLNRVKTRHNIVVIDACRDYQRSYIPIDKNRNEIYLSNAKRFRGDFRANIRDAKGEILHKFVIHDDCKERFPRSTIVSYATMHNQMAKDWSRYDKNHSPYTRQLIKHLGEEEIPIEEVFRRVRRGLIQETNSSQINLEENSLEKNIWLVPREAKVAIAPPI